MQRNLRIVVPFAILLVTLTSLPTAALGQTGPNALLGLYQVSPSRDNPPNMPLGVPRQVCFSANGTWFVPGGFLGQPWTGQQFQKGVNVAAGNGNTITGVGNFLGGLGNDSFDVDMLTIGIATGSWNQWIDLPPFGTFNVFPFRVALTFVSPTCPAPVFPVPLALEGTALDGAAMDAATDADQLPTRPEERIPFLSSAGAQVTVEPDVTRDE